MTMNLQNTSNLALFQFFTLFFETSVLNYKLKIDLLGHFWLNRSIYHSIESGKYNNLEIP